MKFKVRVENKVYEVEIESLESRPVIAVVDGQRFEVWPEEEMHVPPSGVNRAAKSPATPPALDHASLDGKHAAVYAPIPGIIESISVKTGDKVDVGQPLCVLEAMKMKNIIRSAKAGQISEIKVAVGQQVRHHDVLMLYAD